LLSAGLPALPVWSWQGIAPQASWSALNGMGWMWELGSTFEEALELAICADRPLICRYTRPGIEPWPRKP